MKKDIDLRRWILDFLRFKDTFTKSIIEITDKDGSLIIRYKNKVVRYLINPDLSEAIRNLEDKHEAIVTLNSRVNLDTLIQNWHCLVKYEHLTIYFVNPDSMTEKKWIIRPHLHDRVADDEALRPGLESMFSTVDEI